MRGAEEAEEAEERGLSTNLHIRGLHLRERRPLASIGRRRHRLIEDVVRAFRVCDGDGARLLQQVRFDESTGDGASRLKVETHHLAKARRAAERVQRVGNGQGARVQRVGNGQGARVQRVGGEQRVVNAAVKEAESKELLGKQASFGKHASLASGKLGKQA